MNWLVSKRITVTGGAGFLGTHVVRKLRDLGCQDIFIPRSTDYNLVRDEAVRRLYQDARPDIVIHLAAKVGGIGATSEKPGEFFYQNLKMDIQMMEEGRLFGIKKFVGIGTVCAYPKEGSFPFKEEDLWNGYPEESHA